LSPVFCVQKDSQIWLLHLLSPLRQRQMREMRPFATSFGPAPSSICSDEVEAGMSSIGAAAAGLRLMELPGEGVCKVSGAPVHLPLLDGPVRRSSRSLLFASFGQLRVFVIKWGRRPKGINSSADADARQRVTMMLQWNW